MKLASIRVRLTLLNVGVLALVLAVFGASLRYTVQKKLSSDLDRLLADRAHRFAGRWSQIGPPPLEGPPAGPFMASPGRRPPGPPPGPPELRQLRSLALDRQSRNIFTGARETPFDARAFQIALRGRQETYTTVSGANEPTRVFSVPLVHDGRVDGVVQLAHPLTDLNRELQRLTRILLTLAPLALLIAAASGAFLTDRALRPVRGITHAAARLEASDLSGRLPVRGQDEFAELAGTFNGMLARLEAAFAQLERALEQQRRFTADASHELRTPLTIIQAHSSLALTGERSADEYRSALEAVNRAAETTNRIVQDLLLLARADAGQLGVERPPTLLGEVLEQAVEAIASPETAPISLEISEADAVVLGDPHHLVRLFTNLLENAARHTPARGRITVSAAGEGGSVIVTVQDTGEGIPPEHLPHVHERFYRVDTARSRRQGGTGLGLAICQSIVEAHGGSMTIASTVGKGTTVCTRLPARAPAIPDGSG